MDMGESLVGAYMRQVRGCHTVAYNTFLPWGQGELDVIGVATGADEGSVQVWLAEVAVHLDGLNYGSYQITAKKVATKVLSARQYAQQIYPQAQCVMELWSPVVPRGLVELLAECGAELVVNDGFTERVGELLDRARRSTKLTGEPAFRLFQMLTHVRAAKGLRLG